MMFFIVLQWCICAVLVAFTAVVLAIIVFGGYDCIKREIKKNRELDAAKNPKAPILVTVHNFVHTDNAANTHGNKPHPLRVLESNS